EAEAQAAQAAEQAKTEAEGERSYAAGEPPDVGMNEEEMRAYAKAQGDPAEGVFSLEQALDGLDGEGTLWAVFETTAGPLQCRLYEELAPKTVANFVGLARGLRPTQSAEDGTWEARPYYDD